MKKSENLQRQPSQPKTAWTRPLISGSQTGATTPVDGGGLAISKQLQNIASLLQSTQDGEPAAQHPACVDTVKPAEAVSAQTDQQGRSCLGEHGSGGSCLRGRESQLGAAVVATKKEAIALTPIVKRLDNCRSALARAVRRLHDAEHAQVLAAAAAAEAAAQKQQDEAELRALEEELASKLQSPRSTQRRWRLKNFAPPRMRVLLCRRKVSSKPRRRGQSSSSTSCKL